MTGATDQSLLGSPNDDATGSESESPPWECVTLVEDPPADESVVVRIGSKFTCVVRSEGERTVAIRIVSHAAVLLAASHAEAASATGGAAARVIRAAARQVAERARLEILRGLSCPVLGSAGIARAVIALGSSGGSKATVEQVNAATDTLGVAWVDRNNGRAEATWVEPTMIGAAVLGAILECLGASEIEAEAESLGQLVPKAD
jgi:hypothetical protein